MPRTLLAITLAATLVLDWRVRATAADGEPWVDPSPHRVRMVTVDEGVQLEVLDWGGSGPPLVLLHGSGTSAHNFDDFAPKLRCCHVYAITRRGHGRSTKIETGYDEPRLAADILAVIDSLHLVRPIIAGHSMAGGEMTTLGNEHSDRLGGLIYLEALRDPRDDPQNDPRFAPLLAKLPPGSQQEPEPTGEARTFAAYREWQFRTMGFRFPEADLRNIQATLPGDRMGRHVSPPKIFFAIGEAQRRRDYSHIRVPVLSISDAARRTYSPEFDHYQIRSDDDIKALEAFGSLIADYIDGWRARLKASVPDAQILELPGAGHYIFMTREADVLRAVDTFIVAAERSTARPPDARRE